MADYEKFLGSEKVGNPDIKILHLVGERELANRLALLEAKVGLIKERGSWDLLSLEEKKLCTKLFYFEQFVRKTLYFKGLAQGYNTICYQDH